MNAHPDIKQRPEFEQEPSDASAIGDVERPLSFHERIPVSPDAITALLRKEKGKYRFTPEFRLYARITDNSFDGVLREARNLLKCLS